MATAQNEIEGGTPTPQGRASLARCLAGCTLVFITVVLFNVAPAAGVGQVEPLTMQAMRDWSCVVGAAAFLAFGLMGMYRPRALRPRTLTGAAVALTVVGQAAAWIGQAQGWYACILVGSCTSGVASSWASLLLLLSCSSLERRRVCLCLAGGMAIAVPLALGANALASAAQTAWVAPLLNLAASLGALACALPAALPFFGRLAAAGAPTDREVSHPDAFLPLGHRLFVFILTFSLAYGFAMRTAPSADRGTAYALTAVAMLLVSLWVLVRRDRLKADTLFQLSFTLVTGGFALALVGDARCSFVSGSALLVGYMCFYLLMWFALSTVAMRSAADAVPAICWGSTVNYLGIEAGALVGAALDAAPQGSVAVHVAVALILTGMASYLLHAFHTTSLDTALEGIDPDARPPQVPQVRYVDQLAERCEQASDEYGLTAREGEILLLLARGNNARHIQEELSIAHNTVKYHARNVYRKMGVHSQQELIDLLCDAG